ncbi:MAG: hypothetical protein ACYTEE_09365 [Planctomycetota bacterium]|jgi:hypothetical protein
MKLLIAFLLFSCCSMRRSNEYTYCTCIGGNCSNYYRIDYNWACVEIGDGCPEESPNCNQTSQRAGIVAVRYECKDVPNTPCIPFSYGNHGCEYETPGESVAGLVPVCACE